MWGRESRMPTACRKMRLPFTEMVRNVKGTSLGGDATSAVLDMLNLRGSHKTFEWDIKSGVLGRGLVQRYIHISKSHGIGRDLQGNEYGWKREVQGPSPRAHAHFDYREMKRHQRKRRKSSDWRGRRRARWMWYVNPSSLCRSQDRIKHTSILYGKCLWEKVEEGATYVWDSWEAAMIVCPQAKKVGEVGVEWLQFKVGSASPLGSSQAKVSRLNGVGFPGMSLSW